MAGINYPRVLLGALAAGVVANVVDTLSNMFLLAEDMQRMAQRLGLDQRLMASSSMAGIWIGVDFVYAFLIVWTYAAVQPRLPPGPGTAMTVGVVLFAATAVVLFGFQQMGIFTIDAYVKNVVLSLVATLLASIVGAKVYKD